MISAKLGHFLDRPLTPIAKRIPFDPNTLTICGFLITATAAIFIPFNLKVGGLLILLGGIFDMFDGVVARMNKKSTKFGALLDSTLDRYAEAFIFLAIAWYFMQKSNALGALLTMGSLVGAFLISYVRARSEGLDIDCHVGLIERPERVVLLCLGCLTGWLFQTMLVLFFLGHITAIQRIVHVYRAVK